MGLNLQVMEISSKGNSGLFVRLGLGLGSGLGLGLLIVGLRISPGQRNLYGRDEIPDSVFQWGWTGQWTAYAAQRLRPLDYS